MMDQCQPAQTITGFENVEDVRNSLQLLATIVILATVGLMQLVIFLLLLPIPQVPKLLRLLDIQLNLGDLMPNTVLNDEQQREERRKRAAGGFASAIVFAVIVIISMTTLVITHDEPGAVNYSSSKLMGNLPYKQPNYGAVFTLPHNVSADQPAILATTSYGLTHDCQLRAVNGSNREFSAELFQTYHYNTLVSHPLTVCTPRSTRHSYYDYDTVVIEFFTPVYPPIKSYPPPGVFSDSTTQEEFTVLRMDQEIPVLNLHLNFIEMISTSPLDLLAAVSTQRALQIKISTELTTRKVNSTYSQYNYKWPECYHFNTAKVTYEPLFSMLLYHFSTSDRATSNLSYTVSQTSLVSWAFTTIITIGSIVALKPSITHYVTKLGEYWKMKPAVRWTLFAVYTLVVPLPLLAVLIGAFDTNYVNYKYDKYQREYAFLLIAVAAALNLTWVGMLVRHIKFEVDRRRRAASEYVEVNNNDVAMQQPQYGTM